MRIILFLSLSLLFSSKLSAQHSVAVHEGKKQGYSEKGQEIFEYKSKPHAEPESFEIPKHKNSDLLIVHTGFTLLYNEQHEQAAWVAYELTAEETQKAYERTNHFMVDPKVKTGTADDFDYKKSGYDRGHLAPASDMGWSATTMAESFFYSNMSPQVPAFNRGIWKKGEDLVRTWAIENEALYVVTGPVLHRGLETIGPNKVSVPKLYYKVILDYRKPERKGIAFLIPNEGSKEALSSFVVSIDSIQKITGINFFPLLPDEEEKELEKKVCLECWSWKSKNNYVNGYKRSRSSISKPGYPNEQPSSLNDQTNPQKSAKHPQGLVSAQCAGITKKGNQCKRKTKSSNGFCWQHGGD
jgi:endonuclease G